MVYRTTYVILRDNNKFGGASNGNTAEVQKKICVQVTGRSCLQRRMFDNITMTMVIKVLCVQLSSAEEYSVSTNNIHLHYFTKLW